MLSIVHLLLLVPLAPVAPTASVSLDSPTRHIRSDNAYVRKLLKSGYWRSPSFARLVSHLQVSDLFVQIEVVPRLPSTIEGRMVSLTRAHDFRYVRIQLELRGSPEDLIALLGHELQHATEVADATEVVGDEGLTSLYRRIGTLHGENQYETDAAEDMGRKVRRELFSAPTA
ncbi:MAG TPA: hypothetical protein VL225_20225 [Vicinamibacterales bacterium]|jgi:hypothetical protein|nr:hypothetical protein [Vicinamibacterales bacterium]